jgi:NAD(P)H dehydrogenase (quinone)
MSYSGQSGMFVLIIIGYYKKDSFCHQGIKATLLDELEASKAKYAVIDLYEDRFNPSYLEENKQLVEKYQRFMQKATHIFFITPVWWFRCTSMMEGFFDQVLTPNFAYKFKQITKSYGLPVPLLKNQKVYCYMTHGAPALPVLTIYLNSVKMRLLLGVFSFCFRLRNCTIRQFFSVPFVSDKKRQRYLKRVKRDMAREVEEYHKFDWFS